MQTLTLFGVHSEAWHPGLSYASSQVSHICCRMSVLASSDTQPPLCLLACMTSQLTDLLWLWCGLLQEMCGMQTRRLVLRTSLRSPQSQSPAVDSPGLFEVQLCSICQDPVQSMKRPRISGQEKVTCSNLCLPSILSSDDEWQLGSDLNQMCCNYFLTVTPRQKTKVYAMLKVAGGGTPVAGSRWRAEP